MTGFYCSYFVAQISFAYFNKMLRFLNAALALCTFCTLAARVMFCKKEH